MTTIHDPTALHAAVTRLVEATPAFDIHTHLYAETFGGLCLRGPLELVTYHYLQAETNRYLTDRAPQQFMAMLSSIALYISSIPKFQVGVIFPSLYR